MASPKSKTLYWGIALLVMTAVVWIRSLRQELFDWDEHTFMVIAQDVVRGNLPYIHEFDNKPPGIFFLTALFMKVFGQNILAMRLMGATCVFLTALTSFFVMARLTTQRFAGLASLCLILFLGHYTCSELPVAVMVSTSLWLTLRFGRSLWAIAAVGILVSLATIVRSNCVILCCGFGLLFLARIWFGRLPFPKWAVLAYVAAGLVPPALLVLVYASVGQLQPFVTSVILVPFYYSSSQMDGRNIMEMVAILATCAIFYAACRKSSLLAKYEEKAGGVVDGFVSKVSGHFLFSKIETLASGVDARGEFDAGFNDYIVIFTVFAASLLSIVFNGVFYAHYAIIVIAPAFILAVAILRNVRAAVFRSLILAGVSVYVAIIAARDLPTTLRVVAGYKRTEASYAIQAAANAIRVDRKQGDEVWALRDQLIYVYLNQAPPSYSSAHPDNPLRLAVTVPLVKSGAVAAGEIDRIMQSRPAYIVTDADDPIPDYMRGKPGYIQGEDRNLVALLSGQYRRWDKIDNVLVFKRIS